MDLTVIEKLLKLISESELNEVSIEEGNLKVKVKKYADPVPAPVEQVYYAAPAAGAAPAAAPAPAATAPVAADKSAEASAAGKGETIKSPIVGTFYAAPSPQDPDFVKAGDVVKKGDVLCIVEAMKIMNEIESEVSGKIVKVLVSNAQPVEFDQPLFIIEPN
ncbi:MAG: acetyl-CoA carboxylase biotin carboxyl carrier protein [Candidatus Cyclonatronum sp.]|uniref:acetyl-CoA carboxylase biotin carboxyl carrier protein n=1 Tax=Cyclonatronum sp. TaxID=3024185 RepID=UPI0025C08D08|nr:acetyl-CoA carboxylase biotin carboxyl carrier protein [Cyclonatronum sp.]MCC5933256.1 acetyl-CoA carboxylase biotin carboxyl carrier protein [Balneolales bacterium]MCH8485423.1 acetyl-CoA carboxylase biotin carboxyl carrier protein [Cyclonatronum sp.]